MFKLIVLSVFIALTTAAPGGILTHTVSTHGNVVAHPAPLVHAAPVVPVVHAAPVVPIVKTAAVVHTAPVVPVVKTATVLHHATPILHAAPVVAHSAVLVH